MDALLRELRESGRQHLYAVIVASAATPCLLLVFRVWYAGTAELTFLGWNLVLATIPFVISQWMALRPPRSDRVLFTGLFFWLLFFPNAPYIMTDLLHLSSQRAEIPGWFDLVLLLSFAWNGLMLGYLSLLEMQRLIEERFGGSAGWTFAATAVVLGSFGIYVGRFLRWNSWDLFTQPGSLLSDVAGSLSHPIDEPAAYGVTLMFSAFLFLGYLLLRSLIQLEGATGALAEIGRRRG